MRTSPPVRLVLVAITLGSLVVLPPPALGVGEEFTCLRRAVTIVGTEGDDVLIGTPQNDVIAGLGGADQIRGEGGKDRLCGGSGPDSIEQHHPAYLLTSIDAGSGHDTVVTTGAGVMHINVRDGSDQVHSGESQDWIDGESGKDELYSGGQADRVRGGGGNDLVIAGRAHDYTVGGPGNDQLYGNQGDDHFKTGPGDDFVDGGGARRADSIAFGKAAGAMRIDLSLGVAKGWGTDRLKNLEDVSTGYDNDVIIGNSADNWLYGAGGSDIIAGGGGSDQVHPGPGLDDISGGPGDDFLFKPFTAGRDVYGGAGVDLLMSASHVNLKEDVADHGDIRLHDIEGAEGGPGRDVLIGDSGDNVFEGIWGADVLLGGGGNDTLGSSDVESGNDFMRGGSGNDLITGGADHDSLAGGPGDDVVFGDGDRIVEESGDDYLEGGLGVDTLDGGPGRDECKQAEQKVNCEPDR